MVGFRHTAMLVVFTLLFGILGCGPSHYAPSGKITQGGAPIKMSDKGVLIIALYAESDKDFGSPEGVDQPAKHDGTFKVKGRLGTGVPAGKYKVSVELKDPYEPSAKDKFGGKYSRANAKVVEITNSSTEITIDLDN